MLAPFIPSAQAVLEAEQAADYAEEQRFLDAIYAAVQRMAEPGNADAAVRNRAVRLVLEAIDSLGRPSADDIAAAA